MNAAERTPADWCQLQQTVLLALIAAAIGGVSSVFHVLFQALLAYRWGQAGLTPPAVQVLWSVVSFEWTRRAKLAKLL